MSIRLDPQVRLTFGPFELNAAVGELRKKGIHVRLSGQPLQILVLLLTRPGEVVTREQLREHIWADGTFVDFEGGLNAAIAKLRRALGDSAENPRYIETVPGRGYRFVGSVGTAANLDTAPVEGPLAAAPAVSKRRTWIITSAALTVALLGAAIVWRFVLHQTTPRIWTLTRITPPSHLLFETPALSPNGNLIAYSSEENEQGHQDLYVKQITGGRAVRLTFDGQGNTAPNFSPDGSRIVFRSGREGGGIYEIPAWGGPARLIAKAGFDPHYSPDGSQIVFWKGVLSIGHSVPGNGEIWIASVNGPQRRRVAAQLSTARHPIWSPDGKKLLVVGYAAQRSLQDAALDWWLISTDGSTSIRTGALEKLRRAGLVSSKANLTPAPAAPEPGCWSAGNVVTFSRPNGDTANIWQLHLSPDTGTVEGGLERLTTGSGNEVSPSCAGGVFSFASKEFRTNIWSFPLESKSDEPPVPEAPEPTEQRNPNFSRDGHFLTFLSTRSGPGNVVLHEVATGREETIAPSSLVQGYPVASSLGQRVAYSVYEQGYKRAVYIFSPGEVPQKVCEGCLRATDWSLHDTGLLVFGGDPYQIDYLDLTSTHRSALLKHHAYSLLYGRFSPDYRFVSFTARTGATQARIFIAPYAGLQEIREETWISIADVDPDDYAVWSSSGDKLYFTSSQDGFACVWGQKLNRDTHRPEGSPFSFRHLHSQRRFLHKGFTVSGTQLAITLTEESGAIWLMKSTNEPGS